MRREPQNRTPAPASLPELTAGALGLAWLAFCLIAYGLLLAQPLSRGRLGAANWVEPLDGYALLLLAAVLAAGLVARLAARPAGPARPRGRKR